MVSLFLKVTWQMTTVREALEKYLERETLVGDEQWFCPKCKQKVDATKKIDLWKLPPVLVVHLKRFEFDMHSFRFRKIDSHLRAPELFDLSSLCFSEQKDGAAYRVTCVANHLGGYGSGHYTATCRVGCPATGPFYYFDDSCVERLGSQQPVGANAYVVFLTRSGPSQAISEAIPRQTITAPQNWPYMASERNSILHSMLRARRKEDVLLQGWLNKRGPAADFKWARRWCVLHPDRLSYFADEEQKVKKGEIPLLNTGTCVPFNSRNAPGDSVKHKAQYPCGFVLDSNPAAGRQRQLFYFDAEDTQACVRHCYRNTTLSSGDIYVITVRQCSTLFTRRKCGRGQGKPGPLDLCAISSQPRTDRDPRFIPGATGHVRGEALDAHYPAYDLTRSKLCRERPIYSNEL